MVRYGICQSQGRNCTGNYLTRFSEVLDRCWSGRLLVLHYSNPVIALHVLEVRKTVEYARQLAMYGVTTSMLRKIAGRTQLESLKIHIREPLYDKEAINLVIRKGQIQITE